MLQMDSQILHSRRTMYLNTKISANLLLTAFQAGPIYSSATNQGVQPSFNYMKIRKDFEDQYLMIKSKEHLEHKLRRVLIGEI